MRGRACLCVCICVSLSLAFVSSFSPLSRSALGGRVLTRLKFRMLQDLKTVIVAAVSFSFSSLFSGDSRGHE